MSIEKHIITESNADYHARDSISASRLKLLRQSPRVYESTVILGNMKRTESAAMKIGTAIHAATLEPQSFAGTYTVIPADCSDKRTTAYKQWAAEAAKENRIALTADEFYTIKNARAAVGLHPIAYKIVAATNCTEGSVIYQDPETKADCRFRFDGIAGSVVFDIKTIAECTAEKIQRAVFDYGYHVQAAHYLTGLELIDPSTNWRFLFVFVETSEPFRVRVVELGQSELDLGRFERAALIRDLLRRTESGDWSDPGENEVCLVKVPNYYRGMQ